MAPQKMQRRNNGNLQESLPTSKKIWHRIPRNPAPRNGFSLGFLFSEKRIRDIQYCTNRHASVVHRICRYARIYAFPIPEPFQKVLPATGDIHARLGRTEKTAGRVIWTNPYVHKQVMHVGVHDAVVHGADHADELIAVPGRNDGLWSSSVRFKMTSGASKKYLLMLFSFLADFL